MRETLDVPHRFPFRLIDEGPGEVAVLLSAGATRLRDPGELPAVLAIEIMAQAAIRTLPDDASKPRSAGLLVGIDGARFVRPLVAGERLRVGAAVTGRYGRLLKLEAELEDGAGEVVAEAALTLALEPPPAAEAAADGGR